MNIWEHVVRTGDWGAEFRYTPAVVEILKQRKIFIGHFEPLTAGGGGVSFSKDVFLEPYVTFFSNITEVSNMGAFSYCWTPLPQDVKMGRYCSVSAGLQVFGPRHRMEYATTCPAIDSYLGLIEAHNDFNNGQFDRSGCSFDLQPAPVIEDDIWIGQSVALSRNITIGTGSVVGACAVITKNVDPYMVVAGNPARVIRPRFPEKLIERLLQSKWWEYDIRVLKVCDYKDPEKFLDDFAKWKEFSKPIPYKPEKITFRHILNDLMDRM